MAGSRQRHGTEGGTYNHHTSVLFVAAVTPSTILSLTVGVVVVRRYRSKLAADPEHESMQRRMAVLLFVLGVVALLSVTSRQPPMATGGLIVGGVIALFGRNRGLSPHAGCADAAFGTLLFH
ncbi:hypothetical protein AB7C87_16140 [Natrarchaeobius sp. A-rgal3]|uniref:hypothetical protein n=1 Tax=Natrarchaeobius versutus TaxID=1679078 RepID=UPI00350F1D39